MPIPVEDERAVFYLTALEVNCYTIAPFAFIISTCFACEL